MIFSRLLRKFIKSEFSSFFSRIQAKTNQFSAKRIGRNKQKTFVSSKNKTRQCQIDLGRKPPDTNEPALLNYLPCKERSLSHHHKRDKRVSRLT